MKPIFILFLSVIYFCSGFCVAQECKSIVITKRPSSTEYVGAIDIHYDSTTVNKFFRFVLGKYIIESDTIFTLSLAGLASGVPDKPNTQVIMLQFADGYIITKSKQSLNIVIPIGNALVNANVGLNKDDIFIMKNKLLVSIILSDIKFIIPELASKSVKEAAGCLPAVW